MSSEQCRICNQPACSDGNLGLCKAHAAEIHNWIINQRFDTSSKDAEIDGYTDREMKLINERVATKAAEFQREQRRIERREKIKSTLLGFPHGIASIIYALWSAITMLGRSVLACLRAVVFIPKNALKDVWRSIAVIFLVIKYLFIGAFKAISIIFKLLCTLLFVAILLSAAIITLGGVVAFYSETEVIGLASMVIALIVIIIRGRRSGKRYVPPLLKLSRSFALFGFIMTVAGSLILATMYINSVILFGVAMLLRSVRGIGNVWKGNVRWAIADYLMSYVAFIFLAATLAIAGDYAYELFDTLAYLN